MTTASENASDEHRRDLADVAAALAANCAKLLRHEGKVIGNVIDGGALWQSEYTISVNPDVNDREDPTVLERVDHILAENLLLHLAEEFPEVAGIDDLRDLTRENLTGAIVDVLGIAARRRLFVGDCDICRSLGQERSRTEATIVTQEVIDSLLVHKKHKRAKDSSIDTYRKHLRSFEREFPQMPEDLSFIMGYLEQFGGETGRTKRNRQDTLNMLYKHAVQFFGMAKNPMLGLERPLVTKKRIRTLSLDQVSSMIQAPDTPVEQIALDMLLGHGWRQVETRRILVGDVDEIEDGVIWCRGKERDEPTPILPETETRLRALAEGREPTEKLLLSDRIRGGRRQPLGEDGMSQLVDRLYARAGIEGMTGHDLRRSFATLVRKSSGDEFLAMRLLRDKIPGMGERYVDFSMPDLRESLIAHSPVKKPDYSDLPRQSRRGRSRVEPGGDGGESNSPSRRGCPGSTTGIVSSFVSSAQPLLTESGRTSRFLFHRPYRRPGDGTSAFRHPARTRRGGVRVDALPIF